MEPEKTTLRKLKASWAITTKTKAMNQNRVIADAFEYVIRQRVQQYWGKMCTTELESMTAKQMIFKIKHKGTGREVKIITFYHATLKNLNISINKAFSQLSAVRITSLIN